jgi:hypothetical protein
MRIEGRRAINACDGDTAANKRGHLGCQAYFDLRGPGRAHAFRDRSQGRSVSNRLVTPPRGHAGRRNQRACRRSPRPAPVHLRAGLAVGDILMWDNRCTLHTRTDFSANARRLDAVATIFGDLLILLMYGGDCIVRPVQGWIVGFCRPVH